jgi:hypothetical protein
MAVPAANKSRRVIGMDTTYLKCRPVAAWKRGRFARLREGLFALFLFKLRWSL